ncbi:hypothetical protein [Chitinophaga sp. HK235]|uniref:hypothetical protein n=1 Tax=Chitinophaga sp. HK235 TaxID=2952571 RepID=UPI001BA998F8|nr:hypothetical protein [Chitinophaga sp. HK235]
MLLLPAFAYAQVTVVFVPEIQGRSLDGLLQVKLNNAATTRQRAVLTITVAAQSVGKVVSIKTPAFDLMPGLNPLPAGLMAGVSIQFAENKIAAILRQSHLFTAADYEYCFEVSPGDVHGGISLGQQCFNYSLQPFSPLILTSPYDGDQICDKRPNLFWQPLLPAIPGMQYRLILTTLNPGQNKAEALRYNLPLINQSFINTPMLFFPPSAQELKEGKEYIWQVTAYKGDVLLSTSEMWTFKLQCKDSSAPLTPESFRDIEDLTKGNFYLANGYIRFATHNTYAATNLNYEIVCLTDPGSKVKHLPKVKLVHGGNHVVIDLSENRSFKDGYYYRLTITLPDGLKSELRFLYAKPIDE